MRDALLGEILLAKTPDRKAYEGKLKKQFGMTLEAYDQMLAAQNGVCAICRKPETAKDGYGGVKRLSVDHNHETGKVRGLLCGRCNTGLGFFKDNPDVLAEATAYLVNTDGHNTWEPPAGTGWVKFDQMYVWEPNQ